MSFRGQWKTTYMKNFVTRSSRWNYLFLFFFGCWEFLFKIIQSVFEVAHVYIDRLSIDQEERLFIASMVLLILIFCYLSQFILQEFGTLPFPRGHHSQNQNFSWAVQFVQSSQNHIFFHFPWCSISLAQSTTFTFQAGSLPRRSYACVFPLSFKMMVVPEE